MKIAIDGFNELLNLDDPDARSTLNYELGVPGAQRVWYVAEAFRAGLSVSELYETDKKLTLGFLVQIQELVLLANEIRQDGIQALDRGRLYRLKSKGFADSRLATLLGN